MPKATFHRNLGTNILEFRRTGTSREKILSGVSFVAGGVLLFFLPGAGLAQWTGFSADRASLIVAVYLMLSPAWVFLEKCTVIRRGDDYLRESVGWGRIRLHWRMQKIIYTSVTVVTQEQGRFLKRLSHSILLCGPRRSLLLFRSRDYEQTRQDADQISTWMHLRISDPRSALWKPIPWFYYYRCVMLFLFGVSLFLDW